MAKSNAVKKVEKESLNIKKEHFDKLKFLFPDVIADGKINWDKLKATLGEDIDTSFEKFTFSWAGKSEAIKNVLTPSKATLHPDKKESIKFDESENIFIEGDNLEALKLLQNSYFERIKMIYIDPPYNTGNDFVYRDDFKNSISNYHRQTGQIDSDGNQLQTNTESNGRFHSDWLKMLYPRLKLAWNLLTDDGVIFISIDNNELSNLRLVMNEIFGEENFISMIIVQSNPRGRQLEKFVATTHEYLLVYGKSIESTRLFHATLTEEQRNEYKEIDAVGKKFRFLGLRKRGAFSRRTDRPNLHFPIYVNPKTKTVSTTKSVSFNIEVSPKLSDGVDGVWRWSKGKVEKDVSKLEAKIVSGRNEWDVFEKDYLNEGDSEKTTMYKSIWADKELNYEFGKEALKELFGYAPFDSPKPLALIQRILSMATADDDIVLDFFAGSCTIAHAVLELNIKDSLNRKFIAIQIPEPTPKESVAKKNGFNTISDIGKERIRLAIKNLKSNDGFKVFQLEASNYPENQFEFDPDKDEKENKKAFNAYLEKASQQDFTNKVKELDLIYENIIKEGLSLNSKVEDLKIGKNKVFKASDEKSTLLLCLEHEIDKSTVTELKKPEYKGKIFIAFDNALDDSSKANLGLHLSLKTI